MPVTGNRINKPEESNQPENLDIALQVGNALYIAKEGTDYSVPLSGFFLSSNDGFIVSELTIVKGIKKYKTKKGTLEDEPATFPVVFYNNNGQRSFCSTEDTLCFCEKPIAFKKMKVKFEEIPQTLMTYGTAKRFLNGESKSIIDVYDTIKARQKKFVSYHWDPRLYDLLTCLSIATYFFDIFGVFAVVWLFGGFGTGKGRSLKALVYAARKGMIVDDTTYGSVIRLADFLQPTIGIDEYQDVKHLLQGFVRSSYKEGVPATRLQETKEGYELKLYAHFQPTILASTENIDDGSLSRAVIIKTKKGIPEEDRDPTERDFEDVRSDMYLCRLTQAHKVNDTLRMLKKEELGFFGREWEIWRAPLTVAKIVSEEVFNNLLCLAKEMSSSKKHNIYNEEKATLRALEALFKAKGQTKILTFFPKDVTERIWYEKSQDFTADNWKNDLEFRRLYRPEKVGFILKRMGVKSKLVIDGTQYTITTEEFAELSADYELSKNEG